MCHMSVNRGNLNDVYAHIVEIQSNNSEWFTYLMVILLLEWSDWTFDECFFSLNYRQNQIRLLFFFHVKQIKNVKFDRFLFI